MAIDMSAASKAPPVRSGASRTRAPRQSIGDQRQQAMMGLFQGGQAILLITKQFADAVTVGAHAENISREVSALASTDEKVAKAVDSLLVVGPYTALVMAVLPLALQIGVNHGLLPAGRVPGTTDPEVLKAQMTAELSQQAADAMQAARLAQEEAEARMAPVGGSEAA